MGGHPLGNPEIHDEPANPIEEAHPSSPFESTDEDDDDDTHSFETAVNSLSVQLLEQVTQRRLSQVGCSSVLKIVQGTLGQFFPTDCRLPISYHGLMAATNEEPAKVVVRHICAYDKHLFSNERTFKDDGKN